MPFEQEYKNGVRRTDTIIPDDPPRGHCGIEVVLADGRCLRVAPGFDPATLRQVLAVLEEASPC